MATFLSEIEENLPEPVKKRLRRNHRMLFGTWIATVAIVFLGAISLIKFSPGELLILATLSLFCWDALNERVNILDTIEGKVDRLETKLDKVMAERTLGTRDNRPDFGERIRMATKIDILIVAGNSLFPAYLTPLKDRLQAGCKVRIVALNPTAELGSLYKKLTDWDKADSDVITFLKIFQTRIFNSELSEAAKNNLEIRLVNVVLPFTMTAIDSDKQSGSTVVEFQAYMVDPGERLHVLLKSDENGFLNEYYRKQFEKIWDNATPVSDLSIYLKESS